MDYPFIIPVLEELNLLASLLFLLSLLFSFFIAKVRFQKHYSLRAYAILLYAWVFYGVAGLSFLILNALHSFLRLQKDVYSDFLWFVPFSLLSAITGAIIGAIFFWAAQKTARDYVLKLLNWSLLLIMPYLAYTLLYVPMKDTLGYVLPPEPVKKELKEIQSNAFSWVDADSSNWYTEAMPVELFDSLHITLFNQKRVQFVNPANGFSFSYPLLIVPSTQVYVVPIPRYKMLAVLSLAPVLQRESELMIIDSLGMPAFQAKTPIYCNRMFVNLAGTQLEFAEEELDGNRKPVSALELTP